MQIQQLMSRDLTPEDYELLCLLDEGVKKTRTLSASVADALPRSKSGGGDECRICLCELEEGDDIRALPACGHVYHGPCITHWLVESKASCPLCGVDVFDADIERAAA